jgi:hypothetical protein
MDNRLREERIAQARAEIARRIERFCRHLPKGEFEKLLDRMTGIHCKYDLFPHIPEFGEMAELDAAMEDGLQGFKKRLGS